MTTPLRCAGRVVAHQVLEPDLALALAPRPYLHPVSTLAGTVVTDAVPEDHPWHLGIGFALQHVTHRDERGTRTTNFWGGRTYVPDRGYVWLDDHGRIEPLRSVPPDRRAEPPDPTDLAGDSTVQQLAWRVPDGPDLIHERRTVTATPLDPERAGSPGWTLRLRFDLHNVTAHPIELGSPGTAGRAGAGYGGFFWRAAASASFRVATAHGEGEDQVHGKAADWLLMSGLPVDGHETDGRHGADDRRRPVGGSGSGPDGSDPDGGAGRGWSVLLAGEDDVTRADPWFVRVQDYPGVGSALAYERPVELAPGAGLTRSVLMTVLDGVLEPSAAPAVLTAVRAR